MERKFFAAFVHRTKTGEGQRVDTSLFEAGITLTYWQSAIAFASGSSPGAWGTVHPLTAPYQAFPTSEWLNLLESAGVPAGPILSIREMHRDPQALAREMVVQTTHGSIGDVKTVGAPVKFSQTASGIRRGAPVLGEHSRDVLAEYGYGEKEIDQLVESGVVIAG